MAYDADTGEMIPDPLYDAHRMSYIESTVTIGEGTVIRQFATVSRNAQVGKNCSIAPGASVDGAILGDNVVVGMWVSVPFGWIIEDDVFIAPSVMFINDMNPAAHKDGYDTEEMSAKPVGIMRKGSSVGASVVMMAGIVIGENSLIAAGSVVTKDVPPNSLWTRDGRIKPLNKKAPRMRFINED